MASWDFLRDGGCNVHDIRNREEDWRGTRRTLLQIFYPYRLGFLDIQSQPSESCARRTDPILVVKSASLSYSLFLTSLISYLVLSPVVADRDGGYKEHRGYITQVFFNGNSGASSLLYKLWSVGTCIQELYVTCNKLWGNRDALYG